MSRPRSKDRSVVYTVAEFKKLVAQVSSAHRPYENFANFMEAAYCAIAKRNALDAERAAALEQRYMKVVEKYAREPEAMTRLSHLLGFLTLTIPDYHGDFLGEAFMGAGFSNQRRGQFFTPFEICSLMARMTVDLNIARQANKDGRPFKVFADPASGAGALILAVAEHMKESGLDPQVCLLAELVDVDQIAFQMGYLQMTLKGIPAICVLGNALSGEEFERALTPAAIRLLMRTPSPSRVQQTQAGVIPPTPISDRSVGSNPPSVPADAIQPPELPFPTDEGAIETPSPEFESIPAAPARPLTLELFPGSEPSPRAAQRRRPLESRPRVPGGSSDPANGPEQAGQSGDLFAGSPPSFASVPESDTDQARVSQVERVIANFESGEQGSVPTPLLEQPKLARIQPPPVRRPSVRSRR
jgi:hypothetical protein